jgi:hypothetical protein
VKKDHDFPSIKEDETRGGLIEKQTRMRNPLRKMTVINNKPFISKSSEITSSNNLATAPAAGI